MKRKALAAVAAAALLTGALLLDSRYNIQLTEYELSFAALPKEFDGFKIALISDLHGQSFGKENERLVTKLKQARPDLIAITCDTVTKREDIEALEDMLDGIFALAPTYYVNGNHEWGGKWTERVETMMAEHNISCLSNEFEAFELDGAQIIICGVEDRNGHADMIKPPALAEKLRETYPEDFVLWLQHRNDTLIYYPQLPVELVLSGHAHGGIIRLPFTDGLLGTQHNFFPTHTAGFYEKSGSALFVSRGLGNVGITFRLFNRPEVAILTLHKG